MSDYHKRLGAAVQDARNQIKAMKRVAPYIFLQWNDLQTAKARVKRANEELARAKAAWKALGSDTEGPAP